MDADTKHRETSSSEKVETYLEERKAFTFTELAPGAGNMLLKAFMIDIEPEESHGGIEYTHDGEEFLYVMQGRVDIEIEDEKFNLGAGQCVHFDSSRVHRLHNPGRIGSRILIVVYAPPPSAAP